MRIGIHGAASGASANAIDDLIGQARLAAELGMATFWLPQLFDVDALTALAVIGHEVPGIEFGTAVVATYPRHPMVLAGQALTTQAACGNRLLLGIGVSHQVVIEGMFGYSFTKPVAHMREYLGALIPLLRGEVPQVDGVTVRAHPMAPVQVAGALPPPILVAALGPAMLHLAGELADGTITWMVGPKTLRDHIVPSITAAAAAAGRPAPRIVVGLPVCVTAEPEVARQRAARSFGVYKDLPSYRAMLDREGVAGPGDVAVVGDEAGVTAQLRRLAEIGATDFAAPLFGTPDERERTMRLLGRLAQPGQPSCQ